MFCIIYLASSGHGATGSSLNVKTPHTPGSISSVLLAEPKPHSDQGSDVPHRAAWFLTLYHLSLLEQTGDCCQKAPNHCTNYLWTNDFNHWPNAVSLRKRQQRREGGSQRRKRRGRGGSCKGAFGKTLLKAPVRTCFISCSLEKTVSSLLGDESAKVRGGRKGLYILRIFPSCIVQMLDKML